MKVVVTGANRGIGLEFVRRYLDRGDEVVATARDLETAHALAALIERSEGAGQLLSLDVCDPESVCRFAGAMAQEAVDILVNNAGTKGETGSFGELNYGVMMRQFETNALGPMRVAEALWPALKRCHSKTVVSISSRLGSIGENGSGGAHGYRASKTALNMLNRSLAVEMAEEGLVAVVLHPGWVRTDMGGPDAAISVSQSVGAMIDVIDGLGRSDNGQFINWDGSEIVW